ncbi:hypothetical protein BGZ49_006436, partial [Haplosporangium sp. Z 27]
NSMMVRKNSETSQDESFTSSSETGSDETILTLSEDGNLSVDKSSQTKDSSSLKAFEESQLPLNLPTDKP